MCCWVLSCIQVWSLGQPMPNFTLEGHEKGVNCVDYFTGAHSTALSYWYPLMYLAGTLLAVFYWYPMVQHCTASLVPYGTSCPGSTHFCSTALPCLLRLLLLLLQLCLCLRLSFLRLASTLGSTSMKNH